MGKNSTYYQLRLYHKKQDLSINLKDNKINFIIEYKINCSRKDFPNTDAPAFLKTIKVSEAFFSKNSSESTLYYSKYILYTVFFYE